MDPPKVDPPKPTPAVTNPNITTAGGTAAAGNVGSVTCQNLGKWDVSEEPSCGKALPEFYANTASFAGDSDRQRKAIMDMLCTSDCGPVYTNAILAARLGCADGAGGAAPATNTKQKEAVALRGVAGDKAPAADKPTYPQDYPGLVRLRVCVCGCRVYFFVGYVAYRVSCVMDQPPTTTPLPPRPQSQRMGCVKDRKSNSYCAVKRAAISAPDGKAAVCDFYFSCCYAQYQAEYGKVPDNFVDEVRLAVFFFGFGDCFNCVCWACVEVGYMYLTRHSAP